MTLRAAGLAAALVPALLVLTGCGDRPGSETARREAPVVIPELAGLPAPERERLMAWLFCHECVENERDSAQVAMRGRVPVLDRILTSVPSSWVDDQRQRLERIAVELELDSAASVIYREQYLGNFQATVQSRTALLLGGIADSAAVAAIRRAVVSGTARGYRSDVFRTLGFIVADLEARGLLN